MLCSDCELRERRRETVFTVGAGDLGGDARHLGRGLAHRDGPASDRGGPRQHLDVVAAVTRDDDSLAGYAERLGNPRDIDRARLGRPD